VSIYRTANSVNNSRAKQPRTQQTSFSRDLAVRGAALTAEGASQDRCNSSLGERALGCGRWSGAL